MSRPKFNIDEINVHLVQDTEKALEFLRWLAQDHELIGLDVETGGLSYTTNRLRLVQFGTLTEAYAIPFESFPGLVSEALKLLDRMNTPITGHNILFDCHFLEHNTGWHPGLTSWSRIHNTLFLAAVIDSSGAKGLKDLSVHYVSPVAKAGQSAMEEDMKKGGWDWDTVPVDLPSYWVYGALDTILSVHLFWKLREIAKNRGAYEAYELERSAAPVIYAMERKGIIVDSDHCRAQIEQIEGRAREIESSVLEYGVDNIGSNNQLIYALQSAGVELTSKTDTGKWSLNADALEELVTRSDHPLIKVIEEYRHINKMKGSYYENFLKFQRPDGRVHPQYKQTQARTGRMSAQFPAVQTLPRSGANPEVRNSFVADEGCVFISTDFSNVEARIFAHFANETGMLEAIRAGIDLHAYTAKEIYNLPDYPSKDSDERQISKSTIFCKLFGGGIAKVAYTAKVDYATAEKAVRGFETTFPAMKGFQKAMSDMAKANYMNSGRAFIQLPDGRISTLTEGSDKFYVFTNYLIQGYAASLMKKRLSVIDNLGLTPFMAACIHDEVVGIVPKEDVEEYKRAIEEAMNDYHSLDVPVIAISGEASERLGDCK